MPWWQKHKGYETFTFISVKTTNLIWLIVVVICMERSLSWIIYMVYRGSFIGSWLNKIDFNGLKDMSLSYGRGPVVTIQSSPYTIDWKHTYLRCNMVIYNRDVTLLSNEQLYHFIPLGHLSLKIHNVKFDITVPPGKIGTFMSKT